MKWEGWIKVREGEGKVQVGCGVDRNWTPGRVDGHGSGRRRERTE